MVKYFLILSITLFFCAGNNFVLAEPVPDAIFFGQSLLAVEPCVPEVLRSPGIIQDEQSVWDGLVTESLSGFVSLTGGKVPMVVIQGQFDDVDATAMCGGAIIYYFRVESTDPDAPALSIPLSISAQSQATAKPKPNKPYDHSVIAQLQFGKYGGSWETLQSVVAQARWPGHPDGENLSAVGTYTRSVPVGETWGFKVNADLYHQGGMYASGEFSALADPLVEIDPTYMVELRGQMVPASQVYSISYSPNIPEPAIFPLLILGVVTFLRHRKAKA